MSVNLNVHLTENAIKKVKSMAATLGKEGQGLFISVKSGGCAGMSYDLEFHEEASESDVVTKAGDLTLYLDLKNGLYLNGLEIDYVETLMESGFRYQNPNAKASCSCGTSFTIDKSKKVENTC